MTSIEKSNDNVVVIPSYSSEFDTISQSDDSKLWTPESTRLLVLLRVHHDEMFKTLLTVDSGWRLILSEMQSSVSNKTFTIEDLVNKWTNMCRTYQDFKSFLSSKKHHWPYYDIFDGFLNKTGRIKNIVKSKCRLCQNHKGCYRFQQGSQLCHNIEKYLQIKVSADSNEYPCLICIACKVKIDTIISFQLECHKVDQMLKELVKGKPKDLQKESDDGTQTTITEINKVTNISKEEVLKKTIERNITATTLQNKKLENIYRIINNKIKVKYPTNLQVIFDETKTDNPEKTKVYTVNDNTINAKEDDSKRDIMNLDLSKIKRGTLLDKNLLKKDVIQREKIFCNKAEVKCKKILNLKKNCLKTTNRKLRLKKNTANNKDTTLSDNIKEIFGSDNSDAEEIMYKDTNITICKNISYSDKNSSIKKPPPKNDVLNEQKNISDNKPKNTPPEKSHIEEEVAKLDDLDEIKDIVDVSCDICNRSFHSRRLYRMHMTRSTCRYNNEFKCTVEDCKVIFMSKKFLDEHITKIHSDTFVFLCQLCGKKFRTAMRLKTHVDHHLERRNYACNDCDKKFFSSTSLLQHKKIYHLNERFLCSYCPKTFRAKHTQLRHEIVHTGVKAFKCPYEGCGKNFYTQKELDSHEMRVHMRAKKFHCEFCKKTYFLPSELQTHLTLHTGERPFKCVVSNCKKAFREKSKLKTHMRLHNIEVTSTHRIR